MICQTRADAEIAVRSLMRDKMFGEGGNRVVIEAYLEGPEVSVLSFTDGHTLVPWCPRWTISAALDGDRVEHRRHGAVAPNPYYTEAIADQCMRDIFLPTLRAMRSEGCPFKGCLYFGLMLTKQGPKVIEYNARFGDPEAQAVLPLLQTDLLTILEAVEDERLREIDVRFAKGASCCVMVVSGGYPGAYESGRPVSLEEVPPDVVLYHSGTALKDGRLVTAGGRVIGVTATADTLRGAIEKAYRAAPTIRFDGARFRTDIGKRALEAK